MTKNIGVRSEHHDGCDRVTKNIGDVGARSEQGQNIVTVTKKVGDVGAGSEKSQSNVTVTKNIGAGRSRVGARSEQNMIHDRVCNCFLVHHFNLFFLKLRFFFCMPV